MVMAEAPEDEPCPSLLDEPFAAHNKIRLGEVFEGIVVK